jgi:hypothetical protein
MSGDWDSPGTSNELNLADPEDFFREWPEARGLTEEEFREQWDGLDHLADKIYGHIDY